MFYYLLYIIINYYIYAAFIKCESENIILQHTIYIYTNCYWHIFGYDGINSMTWQKDVHHAPMVVLLQLHAFLPM